MERRMLFIVNPHAGKAEVKGKLVDIIDTFVKHGYEVTVHTTQHALDLPSVIIEKGERFDIVVACGGDGTLNEAINGLMKLENRPDPVSYTHLPLISLRSLWTFAPQKKTGPVY